MCGGCSPGEFKFFGHGPSLHLRLLNRAKASPQDEKAVEVLPRPLQRNFADAGSGGERPTSAIPTGEPDFVVFSIIAHDADAPADVRPNPPRTNQLMAGSRSTLYMCREEERHSCQKSE